MGNFSQMWQRIHHEDKINKGWEKKAIRIDQKQKIKNKNKNKKIEKVNKGKPLEIKSKEEKDKTKERKVEKQERESFVTAFLMESHSRILEKPQPFPSRFFPISSRTNLLSFPPPFRSSFFFFFVLVDCGISVAFGLIVARYGEFLIGLLVLFW